MITLVPAWDLQFWETLFNFKFTPVWAFQFKTFVRWFSAPTPLQLANIAVC